MDKKIILGVAVIAVVAIAGLGAVSIFNQNTANAAVITQGTPGSAATKLAFTNKGQTWLHVDAVLENVKMKDGTTKTFYIEAWLKPNGGTVTIDLSSLLGYGNEPLPGGTSIRMLNWYGLFNPQAGGTGDMNMDKQVWSKTPKPGPNDQKQNYVLNGLPIAQLPKDVKDNTLLITTTVPEMEQLSQDNDNNEPYYGEHLINIDNNGLGTIVTLQTPILCNLVGHII